MRYTLRIAKRAVGGTYGADDCFCISTNMILLRSYKN